MGKRGYGQYCGLARALEMVGERWSLLLVRDLLVGPRRFTDLRQGLPRIPTNILSVRLKQLEQAGVVRRRLLPRPDNSVVYELTSYGQRLDEAVAALGRWGAQSLGEVREGEILTTDALVVAMRSTFRQEAARHLTVGFELRVADSVVQVRIEDGALYAAPGALPSADLVITTGPALRLLMAGELSPAAAIADGSVHLTGDPDLLSTFVDIFRIPSAPHSLAA